MRLALPVVTLVLIASAGCSSKSDKGVCVTQMNCFLNQQENNCNAASDKVAYQEKFVPVKSLEEAELICKGWGYRFTSENDERDQLDKYKHGALAAMGWTREMMESQAAAGICNAKRGSGSCTPWSPPQTSK